MENKQIVLTMTAAQVNIVLAHLSNGAFKDVHDLINLITSQGNAQVAEVKKAADDTVAGTTETPPAPIEPSETKSKQEVIN